MKTTKGQAKEIYHGFFGVMRCLHGGTVEENERSAARCFEQLSVYAGQAAEAVKNPSMPLLKDNWLWPALKELPDRAKAFGERYGLGDAHDQPRKATRSNTPKAWLLKGGES